MCEISVIVPIYNGEKTIERCINSILNQTFKDLEIILVDDGSTDNSLNICKEIVNKNNKIRLFSQKNSGPSAARNLGIKKSNGKYIMFCDCDDTVSIDWCQNLYTIIKENKKSMPYCGLASLDQCSRRKNTNISNNCRKQVSINEVFNSNEIELLGFIWNKIFDKEIINRKTIRFDETICFNEDLKFALEYMLNIDTIIYTNTEDYNYYAYDFSLSKNYNQIEFDKWRLKYLHWKNYFLKINDKEYIKKCKVCANIYLYNFLTSLSNTFDPRNKSSFLKKCNYNRYIIKDEVFQECLALADTLKENHLYIKILQSKSYILYFLFKTALNIKNSF